MPNRSTEFRHDAARDCIRGALRVLWPAQGPRATACRAYLEKALAALGESGPTALPVKQPGTAAGPRPTKKSKPRRRFSPDDTIPFPEGWERRGG